jgi:hypothetical protein
MGSFTGVDRYAVMCGANPNHVQQRYGNRAVKSVQFSARNCLPCETEAPIWHTTRPSPRWLGTRRQVLQFRPPTRLGERRYSTSSSVGKEPDDHGSELIDDLARYERGSKMNLLIIGNAC